MEQQFKQHTAQQFGMLNLQLVDARAYIDLLLSRIKELEAENCELKTQAQKKGE